MTYLWVHDQSQLTLFARTMLRKRKASSLGGIHVLCSSVTQVTDTTMSTLYDVKAHIFEAPFVILMLYGLSSETRCGKRKKGAQCIYNRSLLSKSTRDDCDICYLYTHTHTRTHTRTHT